MQMNLLDFAKEVKKNKTKEEVIKRISKNRDSLEVKICRIQDEFKRRNIELSEEDKKGLEAKVIELGFEYSYMTKALYDKTACLYFDFSISEVNYKILDAIDKGKHKLVLLVSGMKAGKTHFSIVDVSRFMNRKGIGVILIAPYRELISQIEERIKTNNVNWGTFHSDNKDFVSKQCLNIVTTPESCKEVANMFKEAGIEFVVLCDEAHTLLTQMNFRKKFSNIVDLTKYKNHVCSIHMTATPQHLYKSKAINYDKVIICERNIKIKSESGEMVKNPHAFKHGN